MTGLTKVGGLTLLPLYTFHGDKRLNNSYCEIEGLEALRITMKAPDIDGVLFQNRQDSWVGLDKKKIEQVLAARET